MFKTKTILFLLITGLITANVIASLNPPTSSSRGTKTYLNYTDMMNETGLRNGSISNITWIGFTPEKVGGILQLCPTSAVNNATLCYNQTSNNLTISYSGSVFHRILDNRTTASPLPNVSLPLSSMNISDNRIIVITYTRNTSLLGVQELTGAGFKPTYVEINAAMSGKESASWGKYDGTTMKSMYTNAGAFEGNSDGIIQLFNASLEIHANNSIFTTDGMNITWGGDTPVGTATLGVTFWR